MRFTRNLECVLSDAEWKEAAATLADAQGQLARITAESQLSAKAFKRRLLSVQEGIEELAAKVSTHRETRQVDCELHFDHETLIASLVRLDTGEVIEQREMTPAERQVALPGVG